MLLAQVQARYFRNVATLQWEPAPGLNLIWGANGQGKTNLIEAIHLALTGRSFRTRRDEELLPWQRPDDPADPTLCQAVVERRDGARRRLRLLIGHGWKRAFADGQWLARLGDLLAEASVVVFAPEDATLFKGPPAPRRRFLDMTLSQLSRDYLAQLQRHAQAMRQLTAAYRMRGSDAQARRAAESYAPLVAEAGAALMALRAERLTAARLSLPARHEALGGGPGLELAYEPGLRRLPAEALARAAERPRDEQALAPLAEHYRRALDQAFDEARRHGACPVGAHRDDLAVRLGGHDLRRYGSQGQHRLAALALRLESAAWIQEALGEPPILLLDDFGSELDRERRRAVLAELRHSMQVIVTATDPEDLAAPGLFDQVARMEAGQLMAE
jgi:DNA replication and repair protein RecF